MQQQQKSIPIPMPNNHTDNNDNRSDIFPLRSKLNPIAKTKNVMPSSVSTNNNTTLSSNKRPRHSPTATNLSQSNPNATSFYAKASAELVAQQHVQYATLYQKSHHQKQSGISDLASGAGSMLVKHGLSFSNDNYKDNNGNDKDKETIPSSVQKQHKQSLQNQVNPFSIEMWKKQQELAMQAVSYESNVAVSGNAQRQHRMQQMSSVPGPQAAQQPQTTKHSTTTDRTTKTLAKMNRRHSVTETVLAQRHAMAMKAKADNKEDCHTREMASDEESTRVFDMDAEPSIHAMEVNKSSIPSHSNVKCEMLQSISDQKVEMSSKEDKGVTEKNSSFISSVSKDMYLRKAVTSLNPLRDHRKCNTAKPPTDNDKLKTPSTCGLSANSGKNSIPKQFHSTITLGRMADPAIVKVTQDIITIFQLTGGPYTLAQLLNAGLASVKALGTGQREEKLTQILEVLVCTGIINVLKSYDEDIKSKDVPDFPTKSIKDEDQKGCKSETEIENESISSSKKECKKIFSSRKSSSQSSRQYVYLNGMPQKDRMPIHQIIPTFKKLHQATVEAMQRIDILRKELTTSPRGIKALLTELNEKYPDLAQDPMYAAVFADIGINTEIKKTQGSLNICKS